MTAEKLGKKINRRLRQGKKAGIDMKGTGLDLEPIKARLVNSTGPWNLTQEDREGVYIALANGSAKWSIVAVKDECDGDLDLISHAPADIAALLQEVKRQDLLIAMLLDNVEAMQKGVQDFLTGIDQGVKDGTVTLIDDADDYEVPVVKIHFS